MNTITIHGAARTNVGKKATKADRNSEMIPCVLYGHGTENIHFTVAPAEVRGLIYTPDFQLTSIIVDGKSYICIIKDVQFHPVTDRITHIDFLQLTDGRAVKVEVPLRFKGVSPGVRVGGKFVQKLRKVKIKTKPESLVNEVIADISTLDLGQSLRVRDIEAVAGVEIINPAAMPIATITVPRNLKEAAK